MIQRLGMLKVGDLFRFANRSKTYKVSMIRYYPFLIDYQDEQARFYQKKGTISALRPVEIVFNLKDPSEQAKRLVESLKRYLNILDK